MTKKTKVWMACYGGGHVQSLVPIALALQADPKVDLTVIGFTTARATFEKAGVKAFGYDWLLQEEDKSWLEFARPHTPRSNHPDITQSETDAYYALGLKYLSRSSDKIQAISAFAEKERKAFLPVELFRELMSQNTPDLVITSTSPRSELAMQNAANALGIPAIAVSDLFLQAESSYICAQGYGDLVTVMGEYVADFLRSNGFTGQIAVTGNPAFDSLLKNDHKSSGHQLRSSLGVRPDQRLVVWICPSGAVSMIGKPFIASGKVIECLEKICTEDPSFTYLVRQHPSHPVVGEINLPSGHFCPPDIPIETCLAASDVVLLETSTVGLQAALIGKPVVSMNAGDYPPYAAMGLSQDVADLADVANAIRYPVPPSLSKLGYPVNRTATESILNIISEMTR